ncbi:hypothetical protein PAXRUDRAFT_829245 [Paxillus rubicundulus Ve08.2h10]|uniref:GDS1 winged helix domain-containing protein n=1 Tax=Paxillus rubicundulus Ve08.2h10 TaxID=930991 RepID=A0A0D0DN22_9AGAM|nr:hypothetical protein PAXRUDRAFT_829245 [Paxillus rubicundulus Ve08.2h10]
MHPHILPTSIPSHNAASPKHNYGTRIRKNSVLKPSARLRQSPPPPHPAPRRIRPVPIPTVQRQHPPHPDPCLPPFPLPNVMLHPEDASSKVFQAIARSFLSVDNRAMTIKDLAEMTLKCGLMCQNVSAASQAITTYIRNHMARCEAQQDHPLLLRHVLSGTSADDHLAPALHSRIGGATNTIKSSCKDTVATEKMLTQVLQGALEGERLTNFRRGTMVWYLSKAAGVCCPFARAGIRLCEYGKEGRMPQGACAEDSRPGPKKKKKREQAQCGEKRKRLRRGCRQDSEESRGRSSADRETLSPAIDSGYGELTADSSDSDSDDERPPKVKLTLRLVPSTAPATTTQPRREVIDLSSDTTSSSSDDDDVGPDVGDDLETRPDSVEASWSLPPYPRRSIAVPCYTPTCDDCPHQFQISAQSRAAKDDGRRSPSVPWSASPPPDSDHDDFDIDADSDYDWDSALSIPSPSVEVKVENTQERCQIKQEPLDVRDMLDAWEDLDCATTNPSTVSSSTIKLPSTNDLKFEELEIWEWEFDSGWAGASHGQQVTPNVKIEVDELESLGCFRSPEAGFPASPCSPFTSSASSNHSLSSPASEAGAGSFTFRFPTPFSPSTSSSATPLPFVTPSSFPIEVTRRDSALTWQDAELLGPDSVHPQEFEDGWVSKRRAQTERNLVSPGTSDKLGLSSTSNKEVRQTALAVAQDIGTRDTELGSHPASLTSKVAAPDVVVVHTCESCVPAISATQVEGISVYQTMLGSTPLLRRIDTDFVNLSTILFHLSLPTPSPFPYACVTVCHPALSINGIWAPLGVARLYAHGLPEGIESIFLSDELVMRFPTALQDFHRKSAPGRLLNQFGPHFSAPSLPSPSSENLPVPKLDRTWIEKEAFWEAAADVGAVEEPLLTIPPPFNLALAVFTPPEGGTNMPETPLSPTEQEMFRALCVHPDWEMEQECESMNTGSGLETEHTLPRNERPLRRSKRVADAAAARSLAAPSRRKGPRQP